MEAREVTGPELVTGADAGFPGAEIDPGRDPGRDVGTEAGAVRLDAVLGKPVSSGLLDPGRGVGTDAGAPTLAAVLGKPASSGLASALCIRCGDISRADGDGLTRKDPEIEAVGVMTFIGTEDPDRGVKSDGCCRPNPDAGSWELCTGAFSESPDVPCRHG